MHTGSRTAFWFSAVLVYPVSNFPPFKNNNTLRCSNDSLASYNEKGAVLQAAPSGWSLDVAEVVRARLSRPGCSSRRPSLRMSLSTATQPCWPEPGAWGSNSLLAGAL